MPVTWTRTRISTPMPEAHKIELMVLRLADALGKEGVAELQSSIWAIRRFKRPTGRSTKAWTYRLLRRPGMQEIKFLNPAVDKRGTNYPRYVHLSGRPRSDLLMYEVHEWAAGEFARRFAERFAAGYAALRGSQPKVTRREAIR